MDDRILGLEHQVAALRDVLMSTLHWLSKNGATLDGRPHPALELIKTLERTANLTPSLATHPIDVMDEVLRPLLGSMKATETAVTIWQKLRVSTKEFAESTKSVLP